MADGDVPRGTDARRVDLLLDGAGELSIEARDGVSREALAVVAADAVSAWELFVGSDGR